MLACQQSPVRRRFHLVLGVLCAASLSAAATTATALPVIPGAVGYGMDTAAGRGGTVLKVTNLNPSGAGSLLACIQASGPRVCIFEVSGVINVTADMQINNPNITIAGQTAPTPGIMIRGGAILVNTSHVLIQHIVTGVGDAVLGPTAGNRRSLKMDSFGVSGGTTHVVIDHCTFVWGVDEGVNLGWGDFDNTSFNNNIVAEGLHYSPIQEHSGTGVFVTGRAGKAKTSMIGNLISNNSHRNPLANAQSFVFANNVVYNANREGLMFQGQWGITQSSVIGNVFQSGPSTGVLQNSGSSYMGIHSTNPTGSKIYLSDNARVLTHNGTITPQANQWANMYYMSGQSENEFKVLSPPVSLAGFTPMPVADVRASVLANAGARPAESHAVRNRLIADVENGTGVTRNCMQASHCRASPWNSVVPGGYSSWASNTRALTVPANPIGDSDSDGYTNLEEWLHEMAAQVEGQSATQPEPPTDLAAVQ